MDITDDDVYAAMQRIPGYVDVSVGDCMAIYRFAQEHAKRRSLEQIRADRLMRTIFMPLKSNQRLVPSPALST